MQSRMDKYKNEETNVQGGNSQVRTSRVSRNQELYKEVSYADLDNFDLNSNVSVLGDNTSNIDIGKIKDILDEKYNETPRKNVLGDTDEIELPKIKENNIITPEPKIEYVLVEKKKIQHKKKRK